MSLPLEITDLRKSYGPLEAVRGLSFSVNPGEVFGLLGPNGAGKTTTISIVTTLEKPTAGQVKVFGHDVMKDEVEAKRCFGVVHQELINSGFFTVREILRFQSGYYGILKNKDRIAYLLNRLGLEAHGDKKVKHLSGGMKRRLMIAKALVHSPRLLLLDEPTAGVDLTLRDNLWKFVRELRSEGISILLTTHYLEEAEELCDRVGIINYGKLETLGETHEIVHRFSRKRISLSLKAERPLEHKALVSKKGAEYQFLVPMDKALGDLLQELGVTTADIYDLRIVEGSLEEAFLKVLAEPQKGADA